MKTEFAWAAALVVAGSGASVAVETQSTKMEMAASLDPEHAMLTSAAGRWTCTVKVWTDAIQPPQISTGTREVTVLHGVRSVREEFKGELMGRPFEGIGYTGYDNVRKQYWSTWMDSMSTGIQLSWGNLGADGQTVTYMVESSDPSGKAKTNRSVRKAVSRNEQVLEQFAKGPDGEEFKVMEVDCKR